MSWLSELFSAPSVLKTGTELLKMGAKGLDNWNFSEEEKAEFNMAYAKMHMEFVKNSLTENSARSLTRRYMAWGLFGGGALLTFYSLIAYTIGKVFDMEGAVAVSTRALDLMNIWWPIILAAGGFYFGTHLVRAFGGKKSG